MNVWDENAKWWRETFTEGADPEYEEQILPLVRSHLTNARRVLDIGCGEGQVCRLAKSIKGSDGQPPELVVGVDASIEQLTAARKRDRDGNYVQADASHLPFASESFDAAVSVLVFEHIENLEPAISEAARILEPGGKLLCLLNHPLLQTPGSGWIDDQILEEQYWRIGAYLVEGTSHEEVEPGVILPFVHRPLSAYLNLLSSNGLLVTEMQEPPPPAGFIAQADEYSEAATIPRLLFIQATRFS